jgi:SAM-dependent methyltransferase
LTRGHNEVKSLFADWARTGGYPRFLESEYRLVLGQSSLLREPGQRVLDIGCGVGRVGEQLKAMGHHVTGVDLSPEAVSEAVREKRIDRGLTGDIATTGLPAGSFDVVLCFGVLLYLFDLKSVLAQAAQLLRPGGELLVFDHHRRNPYVWLHFNRGDWVDRLIERRSNVARRPLDEELLFLASPLALEWGKPRFLSLFTHHPNRVINGVHSTARFFFGSIRALSRASWTGNMMVIVARKKTT